ncbi:hypothetical protein [Methylobacterium soli]|uniref:hypothetical protein n=1 Tax=Methylobacterium soli TaxID=553447 RepID=UPI001EE2C6A0|nr:hypothetical protein [Methylobacterium soli]
MTFPGRRQDWLLLGLALVLAFVAFATYYRTRPTTLTVAVAPRGGSEPALLQGYADELASAGSWS